jgi:formate hydrogenlyase subunit 6/NADH:ubiquinone oxidoreductase subunit I
VLRMVGDRPRLVADSDCTYCGRCEEACPSGALALVYEIVIGVEG